jgi:hypothetical protein
MRTVRSLPLLLLHDACPMPGFQNPLLASRSLRDLWGQRWNQPINQLLKRGCVPLSQIRVVCLLPLSLLRVSIL